MTITQEIEALKTQLDAATEPNQQGNILLDILRKYTSINDPTSQLYIPRLKDLANATGNATFNAWAVYYDAVFHRLKSEYDVALKLSEEALALFKALNQGPGIASCYNNIGILYERKGKYPQALENHSAALKIRLQSDDKQATALSYNNVGNVYENQGNYAEALDNFLTALKIRSEIGDKKGIAMIRNNIGNVYYKQGKYPEALENHFTSLKNSEEIGDKHGIAGSYNNIANTYFYQRKYPEALENYYGALKITKEADDKLGMAMCYNNIGNVYQTEGALAEALENHSAALETYQKIGNHQHIPYCYYNMASIYEKQGKYTEALDSYLAACKMWTEIGDKRGIASSYCGMGIVYEAMGNYAEASAMQHKAEKLAGELNIRATLKDIYRSLSGINKQQGHFKQALDYYEKFVEVDKQLSNEETGKKIASLEFDYKIEKKEQEVKFERQKKEELQIAYDLLDKERDRSENLLLNILPLEVAEELKDKGSAQAKLFDNVTVLFSDFKDFTKHAERMTAEELVNELHACFKAFDEITARHGIEKIKTVGDAYLAVSGLPIPNGNHATNMVNAAFEIRAFMLNRKKALGEKTFEVRIGIHSGKVVAGIVGVKKFAYDIWGDTVNTAARMEQNSEAGKVNISEATWKLVKDNFTCTYRGELEAKNKGKLKMYFVEG